MEKWISRVNSNYPVLKKGLEKIFNMNYCNFLCNLYESDDELEQNLLNQIVDIFYVVRIYDLVLSAQSEPKAKDIIMTELKRHLQLSLDEFKNEVFNEEEEEEEEVDEIYEENDFVIPFSDLVESFNEYTNFMFSELQEFDMDFEEMGITRNLLCKSPFYLSEFMNRIITVKGYNSLEIYKNQLLQRIKNGEEIDYVIRDILIEIDNNEYYSNLVYKSISNEILKNYEAITNKKLLTKTVTPKILKAVLTSNKIKIKKRGDNYYE